MVGVCLRPWVPKLVDGLPIVVVRAYVAIGVLRRRFHNPDRVRVSLATRGAKNPTRARAGRYSDVVVGNVESFTISSVACLLGRCTSRNRLQKSNVRWPSGQKWQNLIPEEAADIAREVGSIVTNDSRKGARGLTRVLLLKVLHA